MKLQASATLRALWKGIHPPLPLEPRQAQKLQNLLSTSFRKHLDGEHSNRDASKPRLTDAHIQRILASPLLQPRAGRAVSNRRHDQTSPVARLQSSLCSPLEIFEEQVLMGQATVDSATEFLRSSRMQLREQKQPWTADEAARAVTVVLDWLWSAGLDDSMEFLYNSRFVNVATSFLVKAGKEEVMWRWLTRILTRQPSYDSSWEREASLEAAKHLLTQFCYCTLAHTKHPDHPVRLLVDVSSRLGDHEHIAAMAFSCLKTLLFQLLSRHPACPPISAEVYTYLKADPRIWPQKNRWSRAALALLGPDPDPHPAWNLLRSREATELRRDLRFKRMQTLALSQRAALLLSQVGEDDKADLLDRKFTRQTLALEDTSTKTAPRPEATSQHSEAQPSHELDQYVLGST